METGVHQSLMLDSRFLGDELDMGESLKCGIGVCFCF